MALGTWNGPIQPLASVIPGIRENPGSQPRVGLQHVITVPLLLSADGKTAASKTIITGLFIAPSDGWYVEDAFFMAAVKPNYDASTLAIENYDASANSGANLLSTTNQDLEAAGIVAKEGFQLTLSATAANRRMDEGDTLRATVALTTNEVAAGEGFAITLVLRGPETNPQ